MDRNTKLVIWIEVALIVILVAISAMNYQSETLHTDVVAKSHEAVETAEHAEEAKPADAAKHSEKAKSKEAPVEKAAEKKTEVAKAEKKAEPKKAEKKAAPKKAAPEPKKAKAATGSGEFTAVIALKNPAYKKHTKGIVQFTHKKHYEDYKIACGLCHHDENAEPLDLKPGDPVQGCIECHPKPAKAPKSEKGNELEYHTNAIHQNCIDCHKKYNKEKKTKAAPQSCGKCHPKKKK